MAASAKCRTGGVPVHPSTGGVHEEGVVSVAADITCQVFFACSPIKNCMMHNFYIQSAVNKAACTNHTTAHSHRLGRNPSVQNSFTFPLLVYFAGEGPKHGRHRSVLVYLDLGGWPQNRKMDGCNDVWMHGWMDGWMDGSMYGWMDIWIN